jgi:tetratricopeptide (TPR) repeat protein
MAFDKVKTLRAAEKYLELGKIPAAITEYCKIVESEPDDFTTLNMLGDLYARVGNQAAAISCFRNIAEHYRQQDFVLKAIAMYKKIDKLQPQDAEIATNLADLYASQDLVVEARAHYLFVAEAHSRAGATQQGLEVLRKIADLDPPNTEIRTRLAEGYLQEGMFTEAAVCFTQAGQHLLARGACDEALEVFAKANDINPDDRGTLKGLLAAHSARGTADEAAEMISRACENHPEDIDLLSMLVSAHIESEDPAKAEEAAAALVSRESSIYLRYTEVARLYLRCDRVDDAVRVVGLIAEQMLAEREDNQLLELVNELLACDSDNVQALRLLVRAHWWQRDTEKLKAALERLADAAQAAGLEKEERYALTQLTRLVPDQIHHVERLNQLGGAEEDAIAESLPDETVPTFDCSDEEITDSESQPEEFMVASTTSNTPGGEFEFEWNSVDEIPEQWSQANNEISLDQEFTFEAVVAEELPSSQDDVMLSMPQSADAESDSHSRNSAIRTQELESVDFYIAQGYVDIALDTLDLLEKQFGAHIDIDLRRQQLQSPGQSLQSEEADFVLNEPALGTLEEKPNQDLNLLATSEADSISTTKTELAEPASVLINNPAGIDPGLAEVFEEYRVAAEGEDEQAGNGDFETHYNLGLAYQEMGLFEEALEEFQVAARLVAPADGTSRYLQCCNLLGHCFMQKGVPQLAIKWFDKGLTLPDASEDQRQAFRFELGAAYEQAGDLDRAIALFTEVYGVNVSYRGVNERLRDLQKHRNGSQSKYPMAVSDVHGENVGIVQPVP